MTTHTSNADVEQAIVSKIEALFRQANHPNTGEHERAAFHAKAMALMAKHRIESVDFDAEDDPAPADFTYGWCRGLYAKAHQAIIGAVAHTYGVRHYYSSSGRAGDPARLIYLFGFKRDCERVKMLAEQFILDATQQAQAYKSPSGYGASDRTTNWRKSFMMGYAAEIRLRYEEAKRMMDADTPEWSTTGSALVLVKREQQVNEAFAQKSLRRGGGRTQGINSQGYAAGREAGRNSNVGRGRVGNGTGGRALGGGS